MSSEPIANSPVRDQMVEGAMRLFTRQGYAGSTMRGIVDEAGTPWGSVHHYFPGGKAQLAIAAIGHGDQAIAGVISTCLAQSDHIGTAVRGYFEVVGQILEESGYEQGCPVATVALEVASDGTPVTSACKTAMSGWTALWSTALRGHGVPPERADELGMIVIANLEGALLLSRVMATLAPLRLAADATVALIEAETRDKA